MREGERRHINKQEGIVKVQRRIIKALCLGWVSLYRILSMLSFLLHNKIYLSTLSHHASLFFYFPYLPTHFTVLAFPARGSCPFSPSHCSPYSHSYCPSATK